MQKFGARIVFIFLADENFSGDKQNISEWKSDFRVTSDLPVIFILVSSFQACFFQTEVNWTSLIFFMLIYLLIPDLPWARVHRHINLTETQQETAMFNTFPQFGCAETLNSSQLLGPTERNFPAEILCRVANFCASSWHFRAENVALRRKFRLVENDLNGIEADWISIVWPPLLPHCVA